VGPRAILDAVVKRKIPSPRRESNVDLFISSLFNDDLTFAQIIASADTGKGKVVPVLYYGHKDVGVKGCITPRILNFGTTWR
jgi:hypothetical protein